MACLFALYLASIAASLVDGGRLWDCCCKGESSDCMNDTVPPITQPQHKILVMQVGEDKEVACTSALWASQLDLDFVRVKAGSSGGRVACSGVFFESIAYWLEHAQQHIKWLAVFTDHILPLGALVSLHEKLDLIANRDEVAGSMEAGLAQIVALKNPASDLSADGQRESGSGLWFIRRGEWSKRIFGGLHREAESNPSKELCLSDIIERLASKKSSVVTIPRAADYHDSVRSEVVRAALEQTCHNDLRTYSASDDAFIETDRIYSSLIDSLYSTLLENSTDSRGSLKLVRILDANGRRGEAVAIAKDAIESIMSPRDVPELLVRSSLYRAVGDYESAHSDCHRASFTEEHRQAALPCMSDALQNLGRAAEALPLLKESLSRAAAGGDKDAAATTIASLASTHALQGRLPEAERFALRALKIRQKEFPENHPSIASALMTLADVRRLQNRKSESLQSLTEALEIQRDTLPENHTEIGASMNNMGYLLMEEQRYPESVAALKGALRIALRAMGPQHDGIVGTLLNLAAVHEFSNDASAAEQIYERLAQIRSTCEKKFHDGQWMGRYGKLLYKEQRHEEALDRLRGALTIWRDLRQTPNNEILTIAGTVGAVLHALSRHEEAVDVLKGVVAVQERSSSQRDPQSAQTLANLGVALHAVGRDEEALELLRRSEMVLIELVGANSPQVIAAQQNIAAIERAQGAIFEEPPLVRFDPDDVGSLSSEDSDVFVYDGW